MFLGERDQSGKVTKQDVFVNLFRVFYQLAARDRLEHVFAALKETEGFKEYEALIPEIGSAQDFQSFLETIPSGAQIVERAKQEIRNEYAGLGDRLAVIEVERENALEDPDLDYSNYGNDLLTNIERRLRIDLEHPSFDSREQFEDYRAKLEEIVSGVVQQKLESPVVNGVRVGDMLRTTQMTGDNFDFDPYAEQFDVEFDDNENEYFHGGDERDVPLECVGELVEILSDDRFVVRFDVDDEEREIHLHPDEFESTGDNAYRILLDEYERDVNQAARVVIGDVEGLLLTDYQEKAKDRINSIFDAKRLETMSSLKRKFGLDKDQLNAIAEGEDFEYDVDGIGAEVDIKLPFYRLSVPAFRALTYKLKRNVDQPDDRIETEEAFRKLILKFAKKFGKKDGLEIAKTQMDILAELLLVRFDLTSRGAQQEGKDPDGQLLKEALIDWTDVVGYHHNYRRVVGGVFVRSLLYLDSDLGFTSEPFSPPSEELERVLKLQVEDGCNFGKCTYCTAYGNTKLIVKTPVKFREHVRAVKAKMSNGELNGIQRIFLAGGNTMGHSKRRLMEYLGIVGDEFRRNNIRRVAAFGRTDAFLKLDLNDYRDLVGCGLRMVYWGIETGADNLLYYVIKDCTHDQMVEAGLRLKKTDLKVSVMLMPGLGGLRFYEDHVVETARLMDEIRPRYITFLTATPVPSSPYAKTMGEEIRAGTNRPLTDVEVIEQMYDIVRLMHDNFTSSVAAYLPPRERVALNPVEFRGEFGNGGKREILYGIKEYFRNKGLIPSQFIPGGDFNKGSNLRGLVK